MTRAERLRSGACYCPDDRCIGHHHGAEDACECTASLIATSDEALLSTTVRRA